MAASEHPRTDAPRRRGPDEFDYDRTVALSDGVFAIALTLLVLILPQPGAGRDLWDELADTLPDFGAYALSFAVLAALWREHHLFMRDVGRIDRRLTTLNLVYLGVIALLPYPTELLADRGDEAAATVVYAVTLAAATGLGGLMALYAGRAGLAPPREPTPAWALATPAVFLASIPIAFASPSAGKLSWLALIPLGALERRARRGRP